MGLFFSESFDGLEDLLLNQLKDLYDAEHRIFDALPRMIDKASSQELKLALEKHRYETDGHIQALDTAFSLIGKEPEREACEACKGLIAEGTELLEANASPAVIDVGIILAAQRIEHYEMAGYGGAKAIARQLGLMDLAEVLDKVLSEEKAADEALTAIALSSVNRRAAAQRTEVAA